MITLGVHGGDQLADEDAMVGYAEHDAAAVLIQDGKVIAAIEEERLTRIKHTNCFPVNAIRFCLEHIGGQWSDVAQIAVNMSRDTATVADAIGVMDGDLDLLRETGVARHFSRTFQVDVTDRLIYCDHHMAHAWSAFIPSGFDRSLVVSLDGNGDGLSGMVLAGNDFGLRPHARYLESQSLGHLYVSLIRVLGFSRFEEYKAMGLAPYGDPGRYEATLKKMFRLLPDGNYELEAPLKRCAILYEAGLFEKIRRPHEPFEECHQDFAAGVQKMLETIALHVLCDHKRLTGESNLCLAGGVAHNCSLNGRILYSGIFDKVFIQPAAHDAGGALGAAWWAERKATGRCSRSTMAWLYHGTDIGGTEEVRLALDKWRDWLDVEEVSNIASRAARLLADGAIVAWVQGRSEFGPRALGNRSILADPRPASHKILINQLIKKREEFRPFAPSVLEERASEIFELPAQHNQFPFMTVVVRVRDDFASLLGAVTHVDRTARIQTVAKAANPEFWNLIQAFNEITGIPVLLNTSFNSNVEPIVDSVEDAITCFLTTQLPYLVVGTYLVSKRILSERSQVILRLTPGLAAHRRLTKAICRAPSGRRISVHEIRSTKGRFFGPVMVPISPEVFAIISNADGEKNFGELISGLDIAEDRLREVCDELFNLWSQRFIVCAPSG